MIRTLASAGLMALSLGTASQAETDLTNMTPAETEAFGAAVRAYLMENPGVIMEAVAALEQQQAAASANNDRTLVETNSAAIFDDGHSWVGGNPEGDVTLVEFLDYRCGYCRKASAEVEQLLESDGNIRFIVKEFPILGEESVISSRFALAVRMVAGDDAYKAAHDTLIAYRGSYAEPALLRLAEELGVDGAAVIAKMDAPEIDEILQENRNLAGRLQINGTPTFVMDETMLRGYVPLDQMQAILEEMRS